MTASNDPVNSRSTTTPTALSTHTPVNNGRMEIATPLFELITQEVLPGLKFEAAAFWAMLEDLITELAPKNNILLLKRYKQQTKKSSQVVDPIWASLLENQQI